MKETSNTSKMNNVNETATRKRVLVTITPYNEQEKREINKSPSIVPPPPPPAPPSLLTKGKSSEDSVEMQSIESFKLKESPSPMVPKPPATYFPASNCTSAPTGSPRHGGKAQSNGKEQISPSLASSNENANKSPVVSPGNASAGKMLAGKVAVRIGAYEGEAKQPSKLDFLSQQARAVDKNGADEQPAGPMVSRLQNELVATLQRSNLRKKTEGENQLGVKSIPEGSVNDTNSLGNSEKVQQSNVEKLAMALSNRVTIRVNPENGSR